MARQDRGVTEPDAPPESFCAAAAAQTATLRQAIADHPFNQALADGTLDQDRFGFYLVQDARYLVGYSRALAVASSRSPDTDAAAFFARSAHTALVVERSLHDGEMRRLGWGAGRIAAVPTSPTALAYTSFLGAVASTEPWPVVVAALLPCFWVYLDVGLDIAKRTAAVADHPYRAWIDTYSDEEFAASVATVRQIADDAATSATPTIVAGMIDRFARATAYEWMFWDSAWRLETWPTAAWLPASPP